MSDAAMRRLWFLGCGLVFFLIMAAVIAGYFAWHFPDRALSANFWRDVLHGLADPPFIWAHAKLAWQLHGPTSLVLPAAPIGAAVMLAALNPYDPIGDAYGSARWASRREIGKFTNTVTAKVGVVLGRVGGISRFGGKLLMSNAPLSVLVVAPAGTGKTAGVILPSILASDDASLFVNDPKGELYEQSAGYRSRLGPVFRIEWTAGAERSVCWNPLDLANLPKDGPGRGDTADRLVAVLVPGQESEFFVSMPRLALAAMILFHVYECERRGESPCFAGVLAWRTRLTECDDPEIGDRVGYNLGLAARHAEREGWPARIAAGLRQLAGLDMKTRSNVLATIDASLRIFQNENVATVTSRTEFSLDQLRGFGGKPITVYVVVPVFDQEAFGKITAMLLEMATQYLTVAKPAPGALPVRFMLDEVAFMPPIQAISLGPAITRGYGVSFVFACQDLGQLRDKWGQGGLDNILTNTAYKVVLAQNHTDTARRFSEMIGQTTRIRRTRQRRQGEPARLFVGSGKSEVAEGVPLIRPEDIGSLKLGHQLLIAQNHVNRPIRCRSGFFGHVPHLRWRTKIQVQPADRAT